MLDLPQLLLAYLKIFIWYVNLNSLPIPFLFLDETKVTVFGQSKFENFNSVKKFHI